MGKLSGKNAVITGGNSGIGLATAELFLKEGANVLITGRNRDALEEARNQLGGSVATLVSDVANMVHLNNLTDEVRKHFSTVDVLFANAGVAVFAPFEQTSEELFDLNVGINFKGLFFTVQKLLPLFKEGTSVILNASVVAHNGAGTASAYSGSKGAILSLGRTLAVELAGKNIRVNSISPGPIDTPIYAKMGMSDENMQEFSQGVMSRIPLNRFGIAGDIAKAALFIASEDSSFMTGSEITVDGGTSINF